MVKFLKVMTFCYLTLGMMVGCGTQEETENTAPTESGDETLEKTEQHDEEEANESTETETGDETNTNDENLGLISAYGDVSLISEAEPFVLEGNENVGYELFNIKVVKIENFTEDGKYQLMYGTGVEDISQLPDSVYALIGTEKKKNNTDVTIEFSGIHTLAIDSKQIDVTYEDFTTEDNEGSTMLSGVEQEQQFAVIVDDPDAETLKFVLSSAFDSETFETDFLEEQQIDRTLNKK